MVVEEKLKSYLKEIEKNNKKGKKINALLQINSKITNIKKGKLTGKVIAVKSNINVKGLNASCGSKVLEKYVSPYDASVIEKIKNEGGLIVGMANCDEFACGSSGETSAFGPTKNPVVLDLISGGSSSGSCAAVAAGFCDMALGSDTGGSIRNPASHCGVVGIKPTYSSVSRYGLIDLSMSLDQIGVVAKNVLDASLLLNVILGKDERDAISQESKKLNLKKIDVIPAKIVMGVLDFEVQDKLIQGLLDKKISEVSEKYNWKIKKIKLNHIDLAIATYYLLVYVEFFSGTRKFDGRRYGEKIENFAGPEVLRRILGGSEISKAEHHGRYYHFGLKAKKLIADEFERSFKKVDCIISLTVPHLPHKIGEKVSIQKMYGYDALTIPSNLAGNCAMSIPLGKIEQVPVGMQIICDKFQEQKMLQIARAIEKI
jgi:aspartyl-tRNA(Asn)/glutamyl-tRNA(Gln) amidotransferase subunit A